MTGFVKKLFMEMAFKKNSFFMRGCVQLTIFVCVMVMAQTEKTEDEIKMFEKIRYTNKTLIAIAQDICDYLLDDFDQCVENWLSPPQLVNQMPSDLRVTSADDVVKYEISQSLYDQAIIIVSDHEEFRTAQFIAHKHTTDKIRLNSSLSYTFWTVAVLENGTHSSWLKGPKLPAWNVMNDSEQKPEPRNYTIRVDRKYDDLLSCNCSNVTFSWNTYDDYDKNFTITSYCNDRIFSDAITRESDELEMRYSISMPLGSKECYFTIQGYYGQGRTSYDIEPEGVKNITLYAYPNGARWAVRVGWAKPDANPDRYQVQLRSGEKEYTYNVSGNSVETTFHRVVGNGLSLYNVSICAFKGPVCRHEFVRGIFPPEEIASSSITVLGSLLAVTLLATVLVSSLIWYRRHHHNKMISRLYPVEDIEDFPNKLFPEIVCDPPLIEDSWEIRPEKLQLHEVIGEGAFGVVRRGTLAPGKAVAVKMLKDYPSRDEVRSFRAEMELMKSVGAHPHVVSLVGCCSGRRPLIVAEYCSRGDLLSYLRCSWDVMVSKHNVKYCNNNEEISNYRNDLFKNKYQEHSNLVVNKMYDLNGVCDTELTYVDLLSFCRQIAMGMEFLASNRVVHRDLATRNILVTSDRTLKIADFGLSRDIYQENQYKQKGNGKMPVKWMALESLTCRIYTTQSDVWSFGVVVWEVMTVGAAPYPDVAAARLPRLLRAGYRMPRPSACSKRLYEMMLACWRGRPRERPTFAELHAEFDDMLQGACAEEYLALDLDAADIRPEPEEPRGIYNRLMEFARGKIRLGSGYASPTPIRHVSNHYSSPPANKLTVPPC